MAQGEGEYDLSIEYANRLLAVDQLDESTHRDLMKIYDLAGKRSAAKRKYEDCKTVLKRELGINPSEETEQVRRGLRNRWSSTSAVKSALRTPNHNLPHRLEPLIGRDGEKAEVRSLLRKGGLRLLTLTGTGGSGKTSLAIESALEIVGEYEHGAYCVDLSAVREPRRVMSAIAQTFGVSKKAGSNRPVIDDLVEFLDRRNLLLIMDNFEQVIAAAQNIVDLLERTSGPKILITSREPLRVHGEQIYQVMPLSTPDKVRTLGIEDLSSHDSVKLFAERALAMDPSFALTENNIKEVSEICIRLDGIPLAIELAASRIRSLSLKTIIDRLEGRLPLLSRGPRDMPERQRTLKNTMEWSYELLNEKEKRVFRRLAIFSGGCGLDAAEWVCGSHGKTEIIDEIASLVDKSLLECWAIDKAFRYSMLQTVKDFALEGLKKSDEYSVVAENHAEYFRQLCGRAVLFGPDQIYWLDTLELERFNLRAALTKLMLDPAPEAGCRMAVAMQDCWALHNWHESLEWFEMAFSVSGLVAEELRAAILTNLAGKVFQNGEVDRALKLLEDGRTIALKLGDEKQIAKAELRIGYIITESDGDYHSAEEHLKKGLTLSRKAGDKRQIAVSLGAFGWFNHLQGNYEQAEVLYQESVALSREIGSRSPAAISLLGLGMIARVKADPIKAEEYALECVELSEELGDRQAVALGLLELGRVALTRGKLTEAEIYFKNGLRTYGHIGPMRRVADLLGGAAEAAKELNRLHRCTKLYACVVALRKKSGSPLKTDGHTRLFEFEQSLAAAKVGLGDDEFIRVWAEGEQMSMKEAVDFALSDETIAANDA